MCFRRASAGGDDGIAIGGGGAEGAEHLDVFCGEIASVVRVSVISGRGKQQ